ncbi:hypothetical protein BST61_g2960 [Cercospora zeina]
MIARAPGSVLARIRIIGALRSGPVPNRKGEQPRPTFEPSERNVFLFDVLPRIPHLSSHANRRRFCKRCRKVITHQLLQNSSPLSSGVERITSTCAPVMMRSLVRIQ